MTHPTDERVADLLTECDQAAKNLSAKSDEAAASGKFVIRENSRARAGKFADTAAALRELIDARQASKWHPISTAPRDVLLIFKGETSYELGFWDGLIYRNQASGSPEFVPKAWAKIPGAPYHLFPQGE